MACEHPLDFKTLLKRMLTFRDERVVACPVCGQKVRVELDKGLHDRGTGYDCFQQSDIRLRHVSKEAIYRLYRLL